eukprot:scaffold1485_cov147-Skeletonema_menzelii.AAC.5
MKWLCLPHGFYTFLPTLLATLGWFATLTEDGCNYAILEGAMVTEITTNPDLPFLEVGLNRYREASLKDDDTWEIDYNQLCKYYNEDIVNIDGVWKFSKMMSFLALVFAGAASEYLEMGWLGATHSDSVQITILFLACNKYVPQQ